LICNFVSTIGKKVITTIKTIRMHQPIISYTAEIQAINTSGKYPAMFINKMDNAGMTMDEGFSIMDEGFLIMDKGFLIMDEKMLILNNSIVAPVIDLVLPILECKNIKVIINQTFKN